MTFNTKVLSDMVHLLLKQNGFQEPHLKLIHQQDFLVWIEMKMYQVLYLAFMKKDGLSIMME